MASTSGVGVLVQDLNPMSGRSEWQVRAEDYDYRQEVARAGFADMLHDAERNRLYYDGLRAAVEALRVRGEEVHVLDIGTGTGLLSMMAAALGADTVTAVEEFGPMAACADRTIADNGFANRIRLVRKRSTEVEVGPGLDMPRRANLLVTEVFDTELIGEGAVGTFNHAHECLLTPDCLVVPTSGTVYAQVVRSDLASRWNSLKPIILLDDGKSKKELRPAVSAPDSSVSLALHDLQLSEFKSEWFEPVTKPLQIFQFDFSGRSGPIPADEQTAAESVAMSSGPCDAVFVWWDLRMDPAQKVLLSCAPRWAHPCPKDMAWRDHWMQAVYYPLSRVAAAEGEALTLVSNHDEYSMWFDITKKPKESVVFVPMPQPSPGLHLAVSRSRLGQINDRNRNSVLTATLRGLLDDLGDSPTLLCLSELSLLPLMAAAMGATVVASERNPQMRLAMDQLAEANGVADRVVYVEEALEDLQADKLPKIDGVIGEPNFSLCLLPWHNLRFWFCLDAFRRQLGDPPKMRPAGAEIWAVPVEFKDLWKIRAPLGEVEGFKMADFDGIVLGACDAVDSAVEPHPLWEYPCRASGDPVKLAEFDFAEPIPRETVATSSRLELAGDERANGVALWTVWRLDERNVQTTGPTREVRPGSTVEWDVHSKQGVHLFVGKKARKAVTVETAFDPAEADIDFKFEIEEEEKAVSTADV